MAIKATLKVMNFRGRETLVNKSAGVAPYFSNLIRRRVNTKRATNIVVTGEPGEGKSYMAIDIARFLEGLTRGGNDRFKLNQIVFKYGGYMRQLIGLKMGKFIVFDEPSYAMGKREWYKDLNRALVKTIESQRFKVHPLIIPIINKTLLDKTIRNYLIQFQIYLFDRGRARVYRIKPSQFEDKIYKYHLCNLEYEMLDQELCKRDTCLDCKDLMACQIFRARYEKKKANIQEDRYGQALDQAAQKESMLLTDEQLEKKVLPFADEYTDPDGKIDVDMLRIVSKRKVRIKIGHNKAYRIAKMLKYDYPNRFT